MNPGVLWMLVNVLLVLGVFVALTDEIQSVSVIEGNSVLLPMDVTEIQEDDNILWKFGAGRFLIAKINRHKKNISTLDGPDGRFRNRLKVDQQTGSLTITNITTEHAGEYQLEIIGAKWSSKTFNVSVYGVSGVGTGEESVFVMEGDSVTLYTDIEANQQETMRWYFNGILITKIIGEKREICSEDECKERFRDRLKLDHQTGSLTITNTDSGEYKLNIINTGSVSDKIFSVSVHGVSAAQRDEMKTKTVKEGESVTLDPGVIKNPNDVMTWYFNETLIAEITGDQSKICSDDECKERFRDRLKVNQTGSLTITNTRTTDSGEYKLQIRSSSFSISRISTVLTVIGVVSVRTRDKLTLRNNVKTNLQEEMVWYFNDILIAEITDDLSKICTNVRCKERFKDRLKLEEFGSLTIMNIRTEDAGEYKLQISGSIVEIFYVSVTSCSVDSGKVSVKEGYSVTLHTDAETNQQEEIRWYFNDILIAEITGDLSFICTAVQCNNEGTERFRDRLKLDHQNGSLTITNITNTDSGDYKLQISSSSSSIERTVSVTVSGVSAAERDQMKTKSVKEGESVTLDTHVINKPDNLMWHFNETIITGVQSEICTDVQCKGAEDRFRDRLKLDHQTGSLTIRNSRTTDSGLYQLQIIINSSIRVTSVKSFSVTVTADRRGIYAGVSAALVFLVASAGLIYSWKCYSRRKYIRTQRSHQATGVEESSNKIELVELNNPHESSSNQSELVEAKPLNELLSNQSEAASETLT